MAKIDGANISGAFSMSVAKFVRIKSSIIHYLFFFLVLWLGLQHVRKSLEVNLWSIRTLTTGADSWILSDLPESHRRAGLWLAQVAINKNDATKARELLTPFILDEDIFAAHLLGYVFYTEGELFSAIRIWKKVGDQAAIQQVAERAEQEGQLDEAYLLYGELYSLDQENYALELVNFLLWRYRQDYQVAEVVLRDVLSAYPHSHFNFVWLRALGDTLRTQERWVDARDAYQQALTLRPGDYLSLVGFGLSIYMSKGPIDMALEQLEQAINIAPDQPNAYSTIATILLNEERYSEAEKWYLLALQYNPNFAYSIYLSRGRAATLGENYALGISIYQEAIQKFPTHMDVYLRLSVLYRLSNQPQNAVRVLNQMPVALDELPVGTLILAGEIYEWALEYEKAQTIYYRVLEIDSQNKVALAGIARLGGE